MDNEPPVLHHPPPLDPAWLEHESAANLLGPRPAIAPVARQPLYAADCRTRNAAMLATGARDHHLVVGVTTKSISLPSSKDEYAIPTLRYDRDGSPGEPEWVIVYFHGGGLLVGEADSEDLSCRRLIKDSSAFLPSCRVYSVGYRLKPQHPAQTCVDDSIDAFTALAQLHTSAKMIVVGSSSGGELAAFVTQHALHAGIPIHGVLLRCPVTSDAFRGLDYVPARFRDMHTSAWNQAFQTSLFSRLDMDGPRDGLRRMPLEAEIEELEGMPRTWIQICTNDALYSDGACYVKLLKDAGVEVGVNVVVGWPHTFWLKAPHLDRALEAEEAMMQGLRWVAAVEG
ncbi:hypothetical protein N0V93_009315 [Gnomoniopsis smithogilvyi]|uniref:Alpha/beta hydrolase fold-3 domain-containing protein n=1 Tax=Gnomoniopsis smithogilvyi TaxID=1191159 RepID=A0A9W8YMK1_9PEZI|nr:hypothetical protein N0V93_009315 [Gnomoniopsis smithogilvyi]